MRQPSPDSTEGCRSGLSTVSRSPFPPQVMKSPADSDGQFEESPSMPDSNLDYPEAESPTAMKTTDTGFPCHPEEESPTRKTTNSLQHPEGESPTTPLQGQRRSQQRVFSSS